MRNTIILTSGWTGSSVYTALLGRGGAWLGTETVAKPDYNTYESSALVNLNRVLMTRFAPGIDYEHQFDFQRVLETKERAHDADLSPLVDFINECNLHCPWAWKDPRLTWTIRIWQRFLPLDQIRFLVLVRDPVQAWITANLRRHIQSFEFTRFYNDGITQANLAFLIEHRLPYLVSSFEDLLQHPEETLSRLNGFLDCALTIDDLRAVSRLPLGRRSRGLPDFLKAAAIYLKNYGERDGRGLVHASRAR